MSTQRTQGKPFQLKRWLGSLVALFLLFAAVPTGAQISGRPDLGDEDGTTVPSLRDFTTGMHLVGSLPDVRALVRDVSGAGEILLTRLAPGRVVVSFQGNLSVRLDRRLLATTEVEAFFHTSRDFGSGRALALYNGVALDPFRIEGATTVRLPLRRLFSEPGREPSLGLRVANREGNYGLFATARGDSVALIQRSSL